MKRAGSVAVLALGTAMSLGCAAPAVAAEPGSAFGRGIAVTAMAWAAVEPGPAKAFTFPPFVGPSYTLAPDELQALRRTGFDFVRLAVDPGPFLQFQGARRAALDRMLSERVKLILASGLGAIVDFHPSDMHPDYTAQALTAGLQTPLFQSYLQLLRDTAALLGQLHSKRVALELMNEPPIAPGSWQPMLEAAYAAARAGSPDLPLILEGGNEASAAALMTMKTARFAADPTLRYAFHYYEPYQFTHQGAPWNAARYLADVPYPARGRPLDDSLTATAATIAAANLSAPETSLAYQDAQRRLQDYRASGFDAATIAKAFARIADWARSQGIPPDRVMLGEFGARQTGLQLAGQRARERTKWFHDVSLAAEANGFGWAVWAYRSAGGFGLAQSDGGDDIQPDIAEALRLNAGAGKMDAGSAARPARPMP
jgi:endoglucanase